MTTDLTTIPQPVYTRRHTARHWLQRLAIVLAVLGPLVFVVAALGAKLGLWGWGFGLGTLSQKVGPLLMMGALIAGIAGLLSGFFIQPRRGLLISAIAIAIPFAGFLKLSGVQKSVKALPLIHDITTDTQDPPVFTSAILDARAKIEKVNTVDYEGKRDLRDKELVSVLQVDAYPDIRPLVLSDAPADVFGQAKAAAKRLGWDIASESLEAGTLEATDTTFWYGFKDDVSIRIRPSNGGGSVLDIRSISRVGASDIGKNADRIREFTEILQSD